ncbi:MAG: MerR family transcriptional regulator [Chloroflexi bacterium]|nr:MerR family transcriptional regulator [Chloroflexota bacterium]
MLEQVHRLLALPDVPRYNIKAVVQQTQVNISTLRAWEQRYGVPNPTRSDHGHRLYSQRDIEIIKWLKQCTEEGLAISQAVALLRDMRDTGDVVARPAPPPPPTLADAGWPDLRAQLTEALLTANLRQAHLLVNTAVALFPVETLVLDLLQPMLIDIGERWAHGDVCVADERVVTNFVRQRLLGLLQIHAPFANGPRLIAGCAPEEQHEIGLIMFSLLMEQRGWELIYLGQTVSSEGLGEFLLRMAPALVCMSVSMAEHIPGLLEIARIVESRRRHRLVLCYSGMAFERHPELRGRIPGIFLGNDLRDAVVRADDLGEEIDPDRWNRQSHTFRS